MRQSFADGLRILPVATLMAAVFAQGRANTKASGAMHLMCREARMLRAQGCAGAVLSSISCRVTQEMDPRKAAEQRAEYVLVVVELKKL